MIPIHIKHSLSIPLPLSKENRVIIAQAIFFSRLTCFLYIEWPYFLNDIITLKIIMQMFLILEFFGTDEICIYVLFGY